MVNICDLLRENDALKREVARLHKEIFEWRDNYDDEDLKGNLLDIELKTKQK
jgi:hypothetical protein